jgi:PAS domain-containing protein
MTDNHSRVLFDAVPLPIFIVDDDVRILDFNPAAGRLMNQDRQVVLTRRGGEALHCLHSKDVNEGCGKGPYCVDCVLRNNVTRSLRHGERVREKTVMELRQEERTLTVELMVTTAPVTVEGRPLALLILEDISELVQLRRMLPICSKCKKIRDDQEYWHSLESYMGKNLDLTFTHGICPTCAKEMLAEVAAMRRRP